ncbi:MAG: site-2 protease family protein [Candidatus Hodarchaeales archaeon]|jgi:Zn-dependent protease
MSGGLIVKRQDKDWKEILATEYTKKGILDKFHLSTQEISELGIAWIILSLVILVIRGDLLNQVIREGKVPSELLLFLFALGISFFTHELMHKFTAIKYGAKAYFRISREGLMITLISIIIGFPILAIGAVYWWGEASSSQGIRGRVSAAGPISNLILVGFFMAIHGLGFLMINGAVEFSLILLTIAEAGIWLNIFLGGFNLLPIGVLDGAKVLAWNPKIWIALFGSFIVLGLFTGGFFL